MALSEPFATRVGHVEVVSSRNPSDGPEVRRAGGWKARSAWESNTPTSRGMPGLSGPFNGRKRRSKLEIHWISSPKPADFGSSTRFRLAFRLESRPPSWLTWRLRCGMPPRRCRLTAPPPGPRGPAAKRAWAGASGGLGGQRVSPWNSPWD